jgi:hypothetical protein
MYQTEADLREDSRRRVLYLFFGIGLSISAVICGIVLFLVVSPPAGRRHVGRELDFAPGRVAEVPVDRLELTKVLPNTPTWSDNIIFVIRQPDDSFNAFLGFDPVSGCILNWQADSQTFYDACSNTRYDIAGGNQTQIASLAATPARMIELPVEIEDGDVFIVDRILRRDRR